jgi:hypothetical protein
MYKIIKIREAFYGGQRVRLFSVEGFYSAHAKVLGGAGAEL